ncbi:bifunctional UDP-3-O-[3-hydroxymyristoyl] N-acetylglucosamine deacetylase/3-hydroxyacyl-ACP dehydratase [Perlabentimonas gracilis]|uniref:bifunctional UDP-3-O-[3-hydroxymyristoyl] N-acetylglucosamine deacetylase/3-hydroxyacyl-ACP dehydratase n=1 Tax=Perlabentimonas gracilis TaxID=2715279 RepID=UPI00140E60E6|nr:bifunctional UDP-3-O-[3-hydroxymyristoyl] N-acetylglucosamine deacetylase/3-hydroxyacyl-ACP dehydratase [Perlabentimonas gracilis]NHB69335.1 bifunctional UDP-3-O-[3-hydroxymyristoyl] N-acetylglucosamine deacetylase/3-hydroxyacyl-ACP dehydratase [Perlabentimonas gracilis]
MLEKQTTLNDLIEFTGKGLHTGVDIKLEVCPAPENTGYVFVRTDLEGEPTIDGIADNVVDTSRGTTIEQNGIRVTTVEHVLASLSGLGIDNAFIKVDGPEMPIMDGSAKVFVEEIQKVGVKTQEAERGFYVIKEKLVYSDPERGIEIAAYPDESFSIDVLIDYNSKVLGNQYAQLINLDNFAQEVAPCRTFVFFHELEVLLKNNLIKGGDLQNAIVIMENEVPQEELDRIADLFNKPRVHVKPEGILNNVDLRFHNEPARHKLLDIVGDLALVGRRIKGKIIAKRPGHHANTELAKIIRKMARKEAMKPNIPKIDLNQTPIYDINQIRNILPHRPPFLLVDKILQMDDNSVVGIKNVTMNEDFFVGHFPEEPVMPGVLQIEAMAQVGGIFVLNTVPDPENYITYFLKIDRVKFKRKVVPGDTIVFRLELLEPIRRGIANMFGQAFVGENLVMEGELLAQIVKQK